ncbi:hypothetical protein CP01DC11_1372A, partial [Chlamydia psittaci 01DC11]
MVWVWLVFIGVNKGGD